jgi:molybdopterin converting factor small subunit
MTLRVELYAGFRKYAPPGAVRGCFDVSVAEGTTVAELCRLLGLPHPPKLVLINGEQTRELDRPLDPDAVIALFPPVVGG